MDRPWQREIVAKIVDGIHSGKNRWVVDAPAGSGKTLLAMELSRGLSSQSRDLKTYVAVRTKNEMSPYDETNRKFGLNLDIKYLIGKSKLCDVYAFGDETNSARCEVDLNEFVLEHDGVREVRPPRKRVDASGLADVYPRGLQSIYALVGSQTCPYISNRYRVAPFTVMTYNYLLRAEILRRSRIDLSGALLIVDEAHNLETAAGAALSTITVTGLDRSVEQYAKMYARIRDVVEGYNPTWRDGPVPSIIEVEDAVGAFKALVERFSPGQRVESEPERYRSNHEGGGPFQHNKSRLQDKASFTAAIQRLDNEFRVICTASDAIGSVRNLLMVTQSQDRFRDPFHSIIQFTSALLEDQDQSVFGLFSEGGRSLSLKPVDPERNLAILNDAKFLVLMSGTMPKKSYIEDVWGIKNITEVSVLRDYEQEYRHVFPTENILVEVTHDRNITTNYRHRKRRGQSLWLSYAQLIHRIHSRYCRRSTLVCVPSYPIGRSIFDHLQVEPKFLETRGTSINELKTRLLEETGRPMVVVAVARGKLLEGVELVDDGKSLVDVVIIAGIPYPVPDDVYKMRRNRLLRRLGVPRGSVEAKRLERKYLRHQPALTTVKQAIGRAVRNPNDRARIFLADYRFNNPDWKGDLGT